MMSSSGGAWRTAAVIASAWLWGCAVTSSSGAGRSRFISPAEATGDEYLHAKNYAAALQAYQRALAVTPNSTRLRSGIALCYHGMKQRPLAVQAWKRYLALKPTPSSDAYVVMGTDFEAAREYEDASDFYHRALALKPSPQAAAVAHAGLGWIHIEMNDHKDAVPELLEATRLNPNNQHWFMYLAMAYSGLDDVDKALAAAQTAVRLAPNESNTWYLLGSVYNARGDTRDALDTYDKLKTLDPKMAAELWEHLRKK